MNITEERVYEILKDIENKYLSKWEGDNAIQGLLILAKYIDPTKNTILGAAEHDIIYGSTISEAVEAGITEEDVIAMRRLNWMEEYDSFACFV